MFVSLMLFFFLFLSTPAWAVTVYLDASPGQDCVGTYSLLNRTCTGTDGTSYTTWYKCIHAIGRGDKCYMRSGTYIQTNGNWNAAGGVTSGTGYADAPIFAAYPGDPAGSVILKTNPTANNNFYNFYINTTVAFVRIGECDVNNTIRLVFDGTGMATGGFGVINSNVGGAATDLFFECIKVTNTSVSSASVFGGSGNNRWTFRNSEFTANPNHDIYVEAAGWVIDGNYFHDSIGAQTNVYGVQMNNSLAGQSSNGHTVQNNRFYNVKNCVIMDGGDNLIYRNICEKTTGFDGAVVGYDSNPVGHPNKIYHNIFVNMARDGIRLGDFSCPPVGGTACPNGTELKNNIILLTGGQAITIAPAVTGTIQAGNKTTGSTSDCFTNYATHDFTQKVGSPCIDAGVVIPGYTFVGSAPDQGVYESGSAPDTTPPGAPTGLTISRAEALTP